MAEGNLSRIRDNLDNRSARENPFRRGAGSTALQQEAGFRIGQYSGSQLVR